MIKEIYIYIYIYIYTYFVSNAFFQLSHIVTKISLNCYLLHRDIVLPNHAIFFIFNSLSRPRSIYVLFV